MQVNEFLAYIAPKLSHYKNPSMAKGECTLVSSWVVIAARLLGFKKENAYLAYSPVQIGDQERPHWVTVVNGTVVDFTYSQFDENAEWPLITSDLLVSRYYIGLTEDNRDFGYEAINVDQDFQMLQDIVNNKGLDIQRLHELIDEGPVSGRALWSGNKKDHKAIMEDF